MVQPNTAGLVTKSGTSTLTLSADNIFTGDLTITAGTVVLSGSLDAAINLGTGTTFTVTADITDKDVISATQMMVDVHSAATINMPINLVNGQYLLWADGADQTTAEISDINSALTEIF